MAEPIVWNMAVCRKCKARAHIARWGYDRKGCAYFDAVCPTCLGSISVTHTKLEMLQDVQQALGQWRAENYGRFLEDFERWERQLERNENGGDDENPA